MVFKRRSDEGRADFDRMETIEAGTSFEIPWTNKFWYHDYELSPQNMLLDDRLALIDSTVLRSMGEALGHSFLTYRSTLQGIAKLQ
ncbi:hypothetical protein Dimus_029023, partial [Dionaea muscipula]